MDAANQRDPYAEFFANGGRVTVLSPLYRGEAAAPKPTGKVLTKKERVLRLHEDGRTVGAIADLVGIGQKTVRAIIRGAGREPNASKAGDAWRMSGPAVSAARRKAKAKDRMAPMMALIAKGASLKSAARQCGIPYSSAQEHVAKLRRGGAKA